MQVQSSNYSATLLPLYSICIRFYFNFLHSSSFFTLHVQMSANSHRWHFQASSISTPIVSLSPFQYGSIVTSLECAQLSSSCKQVLCISSWLNWEQYSTTRELILSIFDFLNLLNIRSAIWMSLAHGILNSLANLTTSSERAARPFKLNFDRSVVVANFPSSKSLNMIL